MSGKYLLTNRIVFVRSETRKGTQKACRPTMTSPYLVSPVTLTALCEALTWLHASCLVAVITDGVSYIFFLFTVESGSEKKFFTRNQEVILSASAVGVFLIVVVAVALYFFRKKVLLRQKA